MKCNYNKNNDYQEFALIGKLDQDSYSEFEAFITEHYTKNLDVVLNLEDLNYISSVGLRSFIGLAKLVRTDKKNINVKATEGGMVKQLIILSGFAKLMPFIE